MTTSRISPMDAARGMAMIFSCLAHFGWWIHPVYPRIGDFVAALGMVATPTFLLISGSMVGLLATTARATGADIRSQLFNRGLFLLTVGHFLIALAEAHRDGGLLKTLAGASIIDEIGLCTVAAAFLVRYIASFKICVRAAMLAAAVFMAAWAVTLLWQPSSQFLIALKQIFVGARTDGKEVLAYTAPTLQYIAIYTMGLPIGHLLAKYLSGEVSQDRIASAFIKWGAVLLTFALVLRLGRHCADVAQLSIASRAMDLTLSISAKIPPSPLYFMFYAGAGLILVGAQFLFWKPNRPIGHGMVEWLATIGRASLFVFVLQYFLYWTLPDLLNIAPGPLSGLVFLGNIIIIRCAALGWSSVQGNKWLTFGLRLSGAANNSRR